MTQADLQSILAAHEQWLADPETGSRAHLSSADLRGAQGYVCMGWDRRGYHFRAVLFPHGWQITAGCRDFALAEAVAHWTAKGNQDALARLAILAAHEIPQEAMP